MGLALLVVLAVAATLIMLISGSTAALKFALVAALWAAVLGFFLVTRYRREAEEKAAELTLRQELFDAELKRAGARNTGAGGAGENSEDVLATIKEELAAIRSQLEELSGREFTYEPAALRAEARRINELEAVAFTQTSSGAPTMDAILGNLGSQPTRHDDYLADLLKQSGSAERSPQAADAAEPAEAAETTAEPQTSPLSSFDTGSFQAVKWDQGGIGQHEAKAEATETASDTPAEDTAAKRGRRRSDAQRSGALSVAELLAKKKKQQD